MVTFMGKIVPSIADAEVVACDYNYALSDDNKDYKTAYSKLTETASRNMSFADLTKMYKGIDVITSAIRVCFYSDEKVVMLLTFYGVNPNDQFQRVEIVRTGGKPAIIRLLDLQKNE